MHYCKLFVWGRYDSFCCKTEVSRNVSQMPYDWKGLNKHKNRSECKWFVTILDPEVNTTSTINLSHRWHCLNVIRHFNEFHIINKLQLPYSPYLSLKWIHPVQHPHMPEVVKKCNTFNTEKNIITGEKVDLYLRDFVWLCGWNLKIISSFKP